jgi:hypothetical protein
MKKQNITVDLRFIGGEGGLAPASGYDQLLAHQDIVYNEIPGVDDVDEPTRYVYPYHAVNFAMILREPETVEAPVDSICKEA